MAEPHETTPVPIQGDGFTTALKLLTRRSESTADTMGFKYSKPEIPKMDLNGGVGTKRVPEAQPLFDTPHIGSFIDRNGAPASREGDEN